MATVNPYAAPRAAVADVNEPVERHQPVRLFSAAGRIGRLRYLANMMGAYVLAIGGAAALGGIFGVLRASGITDGLRVGGTGTLLATLIALVPYFVFIALKTIQRSHDMDWSGWSALLAFIPFVGLIWLFKGGTSGANRFGAPPPPNTMMVRIGGLILPVIVIVGIVAAVALPAYQDYTKRAKALKMK
jgi:uncharacterized membrane protein YhaH (DUF805 family)